MSIRSLLLLLGLPVAILVCNVGRADAFFITQSAGDVTYCADVEFAGTNDGTSVIAHPCNDTVAEQWSFIGQEIVNNSSGKCLTWSGTPGTSVSISTCHIGNTSQEWFLTLNFIGSNSGGGAGCLDAIAGQDRPLLGTVCGNGGTATQAWKLF